MPAAEEGATNLLATPQRMSPEIQSEGHKLQEVLRLFKQSVAQPISGAVLQTPAYKAQGPDMGENAKTHDTTAPTQKIRQSPRLQIKLGKGKPVIKMAQELVARKCGTLKENQKLDNMTLQQYINLYKQPLTKGSIQAILRLTEVASRKKALSKKKKGTTEKVAKKKIKVDGAVKGKKIAEKVDAAMKKKKSTKLATPVQVQEADPNV